MYQAMQYKLQKTLNAGQERLILEHPNPQPYILNEVDDWQMIGNGDGEDKIFVYSAYLDKNKSNQPIIRINGFTTSFTTQQIYCYLQNEDFIIYDIFPGFVETTKTYIDAMYSTAAIICPLDLDVTSSPIYVSLSTNFEPIPLEHITLKIHKNTRQEGFLHKFGVCVQPIYNYDKGLEFIQWIEYNRMMGATFFVLYNMTIGLNVSCIIQSYQEEGFDLEILPWSIPIEDDELLHNHGQNSQANDCVLRSRGVAQYLAMIDLDEYIVPNSSFAENYEQLLGKIKDQVGQEGGRIPVQYGFYNGIFDKGCKLDHSEEESFDVEDLIIYKHITRTRPLESGTHKFITTPNLVIEPGIHELTDAVEDNFVEIMIRSDLAYMHHYKGDGTHCPGSQWVDQTAHYYSSKLADLVKIKIQSVNDFCGFAL